MKNVAVVVYTTSGERVVSNTTPMDDTEIAQLREILSDFTTGSGSNLHLEVGDATAFFPYHGVEWIMLSMLKEAK